MSLTKEQKIKARMIRFDDIPPNMRPVLDAYKTKIEAGRSGDYYEGYGDALQIICQAINNVGIVRRLAQAMESPGSSKDDMELVNQAIGVLTICLGERMAELDEPTEGEQKEEDQWIPGELAM